MRRPAWRPTAASFGPPVSTTRPASIRPWLVSTPPGARPRNATCSATSTPLRSSATALHPRVSFSFHDSHGSESEKACFQKPKSWPPAGMAMQASIPVFNASPRSGHVREIHVREIAPAGRPLMAGSVPREAN